MTWRPSRSVAGLARASLRADLERFDRYRGALIASGIVSTLSIRWWGTGKPDVIVAIPACDEEAVLGATLVQLGEALRHTGRACGVVVFANNCGDLTGEVVAHVAPTLPARVALLEGRLTPPHANAGWARRIALDVADDLCDPGGAILTTDCDTHVATDWAETLCAALDGGIELVCGDLSMHQVPGIVRRAPAMRLVRAEGAYALLQDRVRHCCDQLIGRQPVDGARPHYVEAGANIGITRSLYRRLGGLPPVRSSEDRALVRAAELVGARILYAPGVAVQTSNRLVGRACGGLAATLRRLLHDSEPLADQRFRPMTGIASMWSNALAVASTRRPWTAIHHAMLENEWHRSISERRLSASDLERAIPRLSAFVIDEVEPAFAAWRERYA